MNEDEMQDWLTEAIYLHRGENEDEPAEVRTFEEAGVLTMNKGLVVRLPDGSKFQLTIVQSGLPRDSRGDEEN